jgi:hypothetical protein
MFFNAKAFSLALLTSMVSMSVAKDSLRSLSEEKIITYTPLTSVTDHAALDLDQKAMEGQLALKTPQSFAKANDIYSQGAFSKTYAKLTLDAPLTTAVSAGVQVFGITSDGTQIGGTTYKAASVGDTLLQVKYMTIGIQASYANCQVGANPTPNTAGCFNATGTVLLPVGGELTYSYDPLTANVNGRTLKGFSTAAEAKMYSCGLGCPMAEFVKFYDYYGRFDYADHWIESAFQGAQTDFTNGNANMGIYGYDGKGQHIKKGTAYISAWMYIVYEMLDAIKDCKANCGTADCNSDHVNAWDEAVAFYVGSVAKTEGGSGGYFPFTLAEKRCANFGTCNGDDGIANVNTEIMAQFNKGKELLLQNECDAANAPTNRIIELMTVPLIQGTLRYVYRLGVLNEASEAASAEMTVFAAGVLPRVHYCSPNDAATIYSYTKAGTAPSSVDFTAVKTAFENTYDCLKITCADVGGIVDTVNGGFLDDAAPCGGVTEVNPTSSGLNPTSSGFMNGSLVAGLITAVTYLARF